ncbi:hypothetical protein NXS19_004579 [Fusarium pseudograminearum]|nr:hypothetical protein NXS19_004579 [Fusarium pseudograminearum]
MDTGGPVGTCVNARIAGPPFCKFCDLVKDLKNDIAGHTVYCITVVFIARSNVAQIESLNYKYAIAEVMSILSPEVSGLGFNS